MPFLGVLFGVIYGYKTNKKIDNQVAGLELQKTYILEEMAKKQNEKEFLERNKNKNYLKREEVITLDTISKKKLLLQNTLDLLMNYKLNQAYFRKNFDKKNLGNILETEEEKRLIQDVIIREIRR